MRFIFRNDPKNFFTSKVELVDTFRDIIENKIEKHLLDLFHAKPAASLEILEVANTVQLTLSVQC